MDIGRGFILRSIIFGHREGFLELHLHQERILLYFLLILLGQFSSIESCLIFHQDSVLSEREKVQERSMILPGSHKGNVKFRQK